MLTLSYFKNEFFNFYYFTSFVFSSNEPLILLSVDMIIALLKNVLAIV